MTIFRIEATAPQLMAQARNMTSIDIVDAAIEEPLQRLLQSLNTEAELHEAGAAAMEGRLLRILCNRLRMERDFLAHPEIAEQRIVKPLFLTGAGRTGSTKLHKMLAASGDFLHLIFWQGHSLSLRSGRRDEDPTERIREADEYVRWFDAHAPHARSIHAFDTFEPEEETLIFEHGAFGLYLMAFVFVPGFIQWTAQHLREHYAFLKRGLQYVQWQFHDGDPRRWLLKCPMHFGMAPLLAEAFPDAIFVDTHRNPISTLASQASLLHYYHHAYSDAQRKPILGAMMLEGQSMGMQQLITGRDARPDLKPLDIAYSTTTHRAEQAVESIYAHLGMPLSDKSRAAMQKWEHENSQHKHGVHQYSLEEYSLSTAQVNERFVGYMERFKPYLD